jgi:hypothetical protein
MGYILNQDGSTGFNWKRTKLEKLRRKAQTPGKQKGAHCQASSLERYIAKRNRSYKHLLYEQWSETHKGKKQ